MTEHLLAMELGPVVQLIAAARKTRDLYYGSWMLSEIAKAAARAAVVEAAKLGGLTEESADELLIAPAPTVVESGKTQWYKDQQFAVGDEILMKVPASVDPGRIANIARTAAHAKWILFANEARLTVAKEERRINQKLIREDVWASQTVAEISPGSAGEVVELYAAWVPFGGDYKKDLTSVKRLLLGRTLCRNFPSMQGQTIPKSSLDGRRETVLVDPKEFNADKSEKSIRNRKLRLNRGEQLDAVGITKRVGSGKKNYPSTARLAADPWIRGAWRSDEFKPLLNACDALATEDREKEEDAVLGRIETGSTSVPNYPKFKLFPYEGAILFENRHHEFFEEADVQKAGDDSSERIQKFQQCLREVQRNYGEPQSYYVAMVADGDGIGKAARDCNERSKHRELSCKLTAFANGVRRIVHDQHNGALIFAAGEDISALLPLDTAIACADALRRSFVDTVGVGSLSVGLAIGHFQDALEDTLANAREMESFAKEYSRDGLEKNALAVAYHSRGGSPIKFRASWENDPHGTIQKWIGHLRSGDLPHKASYDLRNAARLYEQWPADSEAERQSRRIALQQDVLRVLTKKKSDSRVRQDLATLIARASSANDVIELANTIIIADVIRKAADQAGEDS